MRILTALLLTLAIPCLAEERPPIRLPDSWALATVDSAIPAGGVSAPEGKSYLIPAAEIVAFDTLLNIFDRHYFEGRDFDTNLRTIRRNLRSSWVVDRDPFTVNQLGHPYQGSMYHGFARASGLDFWTSLGYTFMGSVFWEIAGETTTPSINDQINTGIGGSFLGEALFRMANLVLEKRGTGMRHELAAAALSPPVGFNRFAFGERFRRIYPGNNAVYFSRAQLGFSGTAGNDSGISTTKLRRNEALADFLIDYGMPGQKDYRYDRPFDYFSFQATASSANGFENVMTRGLLKGDTYDWGKTCRGVWGLYGMYDYIAPQTYRVSSTALGLGTTAQGWASQKDNLQGTLVFGLGYTAAGTTRSTSDRDFNYGAAPQALVALRWSHDDKWAIDATGREYYISRLGAADRGGRENIIRGDLAFTYRVKGPHGVSIKYLGNRRDTRFPDTGDAKQTRQTVGLFYTYLGQDRFGAVDW